MLVVIWVLRERLGARIDDDVIHSALIIAEEVASKRRYVECLI